MSWANRSESNRMLLQARNNDGGGTWKDDNGSIRALAAALRGSRLYLRQDSSCRKGIRILTSTPCFKEERSFIPFPLPHVSKANQRISGPDSWNSAHSTRSKMWLRKQHLSRVWLTCISDFFINQANSDHLGLSRVQIIQTSLQPFEITEWLPKILRLSAFLRFKSNFSFFFLALLYPIASVVFDLWLLHIVQSTFSHVVHHVKINTYLYLLFCPNCYLLMDDSMRQMCWRISGNRGWWSGEKWKERKKGEECFQYCICFICILIVWSAISTLFFEKDRSARKAAIAILYVSFQDFFN